MKIKVFCLGVVKVFIPEYLDKEENLLEECFKLVHYHCHVILDSREAYKMHNTKNISTIDTKVIG